MIKPPKIDNAPGLTWRFQKKGLEARWQCRSDLTKRGFLPVTQRLWFGAEPNEIERAYIADQCTRLQNEMLVFGRGGIPEFKTFDGTLEGLIACYQSDQDSPYRKLRYRSRLNSDGLCARIVRDHGDAALQDVKARTLLRWHEEWKEGGRVTMAHHLMNSLRTLFNFGATFLEDKQCERVALVLSHMRFEMAKPRNERLTAEQANLIRAKAHEIGKPSIALAQAIQFECMLRQKDVIGEWVPVSEPGISDIVSGQSKWLRGIQWSEITDTLILTHVTSKRQKEIVVDLKLAPMVMEELQRQGLTRVGPVIVNENHGVPWEAAEFRRQWRKIADLCGIPRAVRNMDSRAGAISEATDAGAELEHVRQAATHGDISMTQRYSRGSTEKTAGVMIKRVEFRNKPGKI